MGSWIEVRKHEKIHNAYTEKFLQLGAMLFMEDEHGNPPFPYTTHAIKTLSSDSLIFMRNAKVLENSSDTEGLFKLSTTPYSYMEQVTWFPEYCI